ncbi:MAG: hypothetical protein EOO54_26075, partial [Haliea sp.]
MTKALTSDTSSGAVAQAGLAGIQAGLDLACEPIFLVDVTSLRFAAVNEAACALAGRSREELMRLGPTQLWAATDEVSLRRSVRAAHERLLIHCTRRLQYQLLARLAQTHLVGGSPQLRGT